MTVATLAPSTHSIFRHIDPATITPGKKPWTKVDASGLSYKQTETPRPVYNARDAPADEFKDVDKTGFAYYTSPSSVNLDEVLHDQPVVRGAYYDEIEAALRANLTTGAGIKKIVIFDHTIRIHDPTSARQPVQNVHVDQTPEAARTRVRKHTGAEAEELLKGRFQLINVWRPLGHAASDFPLGVIDWRTANGREDLVPIDLLYPEHDGDDGDHRGKEKLAATYDETSTAGYVVGGETYGVKPSEKHKFYYVKDMTPDEIMFIKCYDSQSEDNGGPKGLAGFTPHTAFVDPNTPEGAKPRQSIEVRALVFYD